MNILGIESTAHTFGIGIITGRGKILANIYDSHQTPPGTGMVIEDVVAHHQKVADQVLKKSLHQSQTRLVRHFFHCLFCWPWN